MKIRIKKILKISTMCLLLLFVACSSDEGKKEMSLEEFATLGKDTLTSVSEETMKEIIEAIPPAVEMASLIKATGNEYNSALLNSTDNLQGYSTANKKALAIGIYGADLGYINIYERTYSAINYLDVIKGLADDIKAGQFFDFETLKRLAKSSKNTDSLLRISTDCFNNMDEYLREQKRGKLSVLMACGAWLEGIYIASQLQKQTNNEELKERIGEQKPLLDNLLVILNLYSHDPYFAELISGFESVKSQYKGVSITTEYMEPETKEINGELVIIDNSKSTVNITDDQLKSIISAIEQLRNKVIK